MQQPTPSQAATLARYRDVQGTFTPDELRRTLSGLSPGGLQIKCLVEDAAEMDLLYKTFTEVTGPA